MHSLGEGVFAELDRVRRERDEARAALRNLIVSVLFVRGTGCDLDDSELEEARAAALLPEKQTEGK